MRTGEDEDEYAWTFIHGPGIDDPIMAHRKQSEYDHLYIYYVTDGRGRQLAVGDSVGYDYANPDSTAQGAAGSNAEEYLSNGGKYAGGMHDSFGFQPERHPATEAPDLSFFRNRWFDQKTGRWTQEDPLGLAAGTNLYNCVGNNPTAYTDPFGLCPPELTGRSCQNVLGGVQLSLRTDVPSGFGVIPERSAGIHQGADFVAAVGTTVTAADAGVVDRVGYDPNGFGHYIQLAHSNQQGQVVSYSLYGHLSKAPFRELGSAVGAREAIGLSGQSGNAGGTPPHLHFEIRTKSYPGRGLPNRCDPVMALAGVGGACQ